MPLAKLLSRMGIALVVVIGSISTAEAQWTAVAAPGAFLDTCVLLTDGSVMCHVYSTNRWRRLTPDINGSYAAGTWADTAPMPNGVDSTAACSVAGGCTYAPLYYASAVLPDGRVVVVGGEYNNGPATWTDIGFMYDPVSDTWSGQLSVPWNAGSAGDNQATVLEDGTLALAQGVGFNIGLFNPATLTFTAINPTGKADNNNEEGWNILPDGSLLAVDARIQAQSERYDPGTNNWDDRTSTVVNMADTPDLGGSAEVGPGVVRPDGTMIYFSGNSTGQNAVYDIATGTWSNTAAMNFPISAGTDHFAVADGPASLLPNGNVLVMASPVTNSSPFNAPSHFYEFDGTNLTAVADSPNAAAFTSYQGRMVLLPTGEVLLTAYNQGATQDVVLYSNGGAPQDAWRPVITAAPNSVDPSMTYTISGKQFNGFSEGANYGDDAQSSTNYPLVRITNQSTGHVFYARTFGHSRMGIETPGTPDADEIVTTHFTTPAGLESGLSDLVVVTNGIPSVPFVVNGPGLSIPGPLSLDACVGSTVTTTLNVCNTGHQNLAINNIVSSDPQFTVDTPSSGYSVVISPDFCFPFQVHFTPSAAGTTNANLTIDSNDPNHPVTQVAVTGTSGSPQINATLLAGGSFGNVCAGSQSELVLELINQGTCNLNITNLLSSNPEFQVPTTLSLPLILSHDATVDIPIRFRPTGACSDTIPETSNITVVSNDPIQPNFVVHVSGIQGCPKLVVSPEDLSGLFAFPATVSDPTGQLGCYTDRQITLSNAGVCPLDVTSVTATSTSNAFTVINPTGAFIIPPGGGSVGVTVRFKPISLTGQLPDAPDEQTGTLTIASNNPTPVTADLCGEPFYKSGIRVLVTNGSGVPYNPLDSLTLSSKGVSPSVMQKLTDLVPASASICGKPAITYHLDNETLYPAGSSGSNPKGSYQLTVKAGGKPSSTSFTLGQCEAKEFVVQIK